MMQKFLNVILDNFKKNTRGNILALFVLWFGSSLIAGCASSPSHQTVTYQKPLQPVLPSATMMPQSSLPLRNIYHEVGPCETLWRISKVYDVDMETIMRVNHLTDKTQLKKGMKLLIPNTRGPRANIPLFPTNRWTHIVIHHTATDEGSAYSIDGAHQQRGWENGMGYHFLIDNGTRGKTIGQIEVGPRWLKQMQGAHVKVGQWNQKSIGIAVVGNYSEDRIDERIFESLLFLTYTLKNYYHIPDQNIVGHRDVPDAATECPGKFFPWNDFKRRLKNY